MVDSVDLFLALNTQWNWTGAGMAGAFRSGINYSSIEPISRLAKIEVTPLVFNDLKVMENEALKTWARG